MFVKIIKVSDDNFNGNHPNNINEGYTKSGFFHNPPIVGERFRITNHDSWFTTSNVTEILTKNKAGNITAFKTVNSTYKIEYQPE